MIILREPQAHVIRLIRTAQSELWLLERAMREQPEQVAAQVALLEAAVLANLLKARETIEAVPCCREAWDTLAGRSMKATLHQRPCPAWMVEGPGPGNCREAAGGSKWARHKGSLVKLGIREGTGSGRGETLLTSNECEGFTCVPGALSNSKPSNRKWLPVRRSHKCRPQGNLVLPRQSSSSLPVSIWLFLR
ncbi:hypothetical protein DC20_20920 [Rufibacter tibetensis]|uniref:Uncharacterized protein n=1 Tax=Rufibacter tibetensis TaxID=512763 RepID=A0A0P0CZS5_9BACT|nr:hypothetical protein DC20_20920 [Rufibacter tibetensis]